MSMGFIAIIARGLRWSNLLEPMGYFPKKWNNIHAVSLSYFVSLVIPRSGELVRCTALNQAEDIPVDKLFGTVVLERVIDTAILLLFVGLAFLLNYDVFTNLLERVGTKGATTTPWWIYAVGVFIISILLLLILFRKKIAQSKIWEKVKAFLQGMKEGFLSIRQMDKKWEFVIYSVIIWGMYYLSMITMLKALHMNEYGLNAALFLVVAGGLGVIVPTQNGIGTYHLLIKLGVAVLAVAYGYFPDKTELEIEEIGLSLAWLQWGGQTIMMILAGLVATVSFAIQKKRKHVS